MSAIELFARLAYPYPVLHMLPAARTNMGVVVTVGAAMVAAVFTTFSQDTAPLRPGKLVLGLVAAYCRMSFRVLGQSPCIA